MEYEIQPGRKFSFGFRELIRYAELLYFFTWRDIKVKYKQTTLGVLWAILQPMLFMLVFMFAIGKYMQANLDIPYTVFAFSGLMLWNIFSSGVISAGNSMVTNAPIIKKIY